MGTYSPPSSATIPLNTDKAGVSGARRVGLRNLEEGLNKLEQESGIDLDGDGDVGEPNAVAAPSAAPGVASSSSYAAAWADGGCGT